MAISWRNFPISSIFHDETLGKKWEAFLGCHPYLQQDDSSVKSARRTGTVHHYVVAVALHSDLGLTDEEAEDIGRILGRDPNLVETAMYAVMWSEHVSYKSSRIHLRRLPGDGPAVLVGPGENAGVIDAGDGVAVALRIESHNHPSAIEPFQGAATGVGGILRDVFTMGARPIALMDSLHFGPLDDPHSRRILRGVVSGISSYGNSVGVPTVGGEVSLGGSYTSNPLVNVLCVGLLPSSRLVLGRASGVGNLVVLMGATTGRDGIGGVSVLASSELDEAASEKRPSVQVGDPYCEKRLIEACLALLDSNLLVGLQDLGGAGLTCACSESAARAGVGMEVYTSEVPLRELGMAPVEIMTSESQERMLAIVRPHDIEDMREVCTRMGVTAAVVGRVVDPVGGVGRLRVLDRPGGTVLADVPASSLATAAPLYERPMAAPPQRVADEGALERPPSDVGVDLLSMLMSTEWVWRQYDHQLFNNTVVGPGGDATLLRLSAPGVSAPPGRAMALSTDGNGRWCSVQPRMGAAMVVAESALNVACSGARPAALVDCLNFGNPEHPVVMWQLSEVVDGIAEAARALSVPVVGGNVSLYNAAGGIDIDPTPVIGTIGFLAGMSRQPPGPALEEGSSVVLLGPRSTALGGSRWSIERRGEPGSSLPPLDLELHARLLGMIADLVSDVVSGSAPEGLVCGIHDVSEGGLGVALAEMSLKTGVGCRVLDVEGHAELFSEASSRVVVCTKRPEELAERARAAGVPYGVLGSAGGDRLVVEGLVDLSVAQLEETFRDRLPEAMAIPGAASA